MVLQLRVLLLAMTACGGTTADEYDSRRGCATGDSMEACAKLICQCTPNGFSNYVSVSAVRARSPRTPARG